jgi:hypothetical protein
MLLCMQTRYLSFLHSIYGEQVVSMKQREDRPDLPFILVLPYGRGFQEVMNTPLVLPPLEVEIYGAKPNILSL